MNVFNYEFPADKGHYFSSPRVCFSTVSSSINALVAVTVEDFIRPVYKNLTDKQVTWMNMGLSEFHTKHCV